MKYVVYRTSLVFSLGVEDEKPCDIATKEIVDVFYKDRSDKSEEWVVDVDDLVAFADEVGEKIIIHPNKKSSVCSYSYPEIEIYDTYRE